MARQKKTPTPANGGRVTSRDVLIAVQGVYERIDATNARVDEIVAGQEGIREALHALRETTNEALHTVEGRVNRLERPWRLLAGGWQKALVAAGAATAVTGLVARFVGLGWLPF